MCLRLGPSFLLPLFTVRPRRGVLRSWTSALRSSRKFLSSKYVLWSTYCSGVHTSPSHREYVRAVTSDGGGVWTPSLRLTCRPSYQGGPHGKVRLRHLQQGHPRQVRLQADARGHGRRVAAVRRLPPAERHRSLAAPPSAPRRGLHGLERHPGHH